MLFRTSLATVMTAIAVTGPAVAADVAFIDKIQAEITKVLQELAAEEKVGAADITKLAYYRGAPFAWAWLANEGHPAYMGHITMAEMMAPLLTEQDRNYPE